MRPDDFRSTCTCKGPAVARTRKHRSSMSKSTRGRVTVRQGRVFGISCLAVAIIGACTLTTPAQAHGFGQRYDLPLPLSLYLFGTAAAVVLSFVIVGLFARHTPGAQGYPRLDVLAYPPGRWLANPILPGLLKLIAASVFVLTVTAGFCGSQDPYRNIAPTLVWTIWWVGLAIFSAFVGDLWAVVNPWRSLFDGADRVYRMLT